MAERSYQPLGFSPVRAVTGDAHREPRTRATGGSGQGTFRAGVQMGRWVAACARMTPSRACIQIGAEILQARIDEQGHDRMPGTQPLGHPDSGDDVGA